VFTPVSPPLRTVPGVTPPVDARQCAAVERDLRALRDALLAAESRQIDAIARTHPAHRRSAVNLVHYVEMRQHDIRDLQDRLTALGLSSLGRCEGHVLANVETTLSVATRLAGSTAGASAAGLSIGEGRQLLAVNASRLLGPSPADRATRIMVTLPGTVAGDDVLVARMCTAGMDVARINCAHDDPDTWSRMAARVRSARADVRITTDLAGPKVRTVVRGRPPRLAPGDRLLIAATADGDADTPTIGCTIEDLASMVRAGERVWFDDGKIGGVIEQVVDGAIDVVIVEARGGRSRLKDGKGLNLPDSHLTVAALTQRDVDDLTSVIGFTDVVNMSFVRSATDVRQLLDELDRLDAGGVGVILKIENMHAFEQLPDLLLAVMARRDVGVMIARGDLAVEVGFERMAEIQEEILWACEAAHVPVVWATGVMTSLAKTGMPSRAEVTDAAMAVRAECVMLNKGDYIVDAIDSLASTM
jgi:pyruvate kinase